MPSFDVNAIASNEYLSQFDIFKENYEVQRFNDTGMVNIDPIKILKYFEPNIVIYNRDGNVYDKTVVPFVSCKPEWFEVIEDKSNHEFIDHRLCADKDALDGLWKLKGGYTNS